MAAESVYIYPYQMGGEEDPIVIIQSGTKNVRVYGKVNTSTGEYEPPTLTEDVAKAKEKGAQVAIRVGKIFQEYCKTPVEKIT